MHPNTDKNGKFSIEACRFALNLPLSATPPKILATEAWYSEAKALRALALWGEWIGVRELAHSKHIHSPHTTTVGCEAFAHKTKQRSAYKRQTAARVEVAGTEPNLLIPLISLLFQTTI